VNVADIVFNFRTVPALIVLFATLAIMLSFGLIVFVRTYNKLYGWYFLLTMVGIGGWAIGDLLLLFSRSASLLHSGAELFYIAPMIIPVFIWFFAISFPEDKPVGWGPFLLASSFFGVFSYLFITHLDIFITSIQITNTLNVPRPALPGFLIYAGYFSLFFICTYIAFMRKMQKLKGISRTQISYNLIGALLASIPALFTNLSLPLMGYAGIIWLGPLFTITFAIAVTIAIVRHKLFDIRIYAVRSAAYLLTLFAAGLLYVIPAVLLSSFFLHAPLQTRTVLLLALVTLAVAFLFQPLKRFFDRFTRKWFYRDSYDAQTLIDQLNKTLVANINMEDLLTKAADIIVTNLKSEFGIFGLNKTDFAEQRLIGTTRKVFPAKDIAFVRHTTPKFDNNVIVADYLDDEHEALKEVLLKNDIAVLVRLASYAHPHEEGLGYLILGQKRSGNPYGLQDTRILDIISRELFLAVQNALHFEEIERFNQTLQQKIDDATKKLRHSNEKLRMLDQTKDDFISMASHQLRTPLTSVKGYVSMVLDGDAGKVTPLQRKLLSQSFISSQRMVYLISDLLNVSRLRTGKFVIEPIPCNLAKVIKDEIEQLEETAKGRDLELTYAHPEHFPTYLLDETKMRQVIMNFIDNAIYYTQSGGHIHVALVDRPQTIEFTVTDDGIGVPKHEQPHLFTKFYRAHNARRARPDGTGLGLFMAKKVIVAQGGATIFKSQEGRGSTFGFSFAKSALKSPEQKSDE